MIDRASQIATLGKKFRFAWSEGHEQLYKYLSYAGESRSRVHEIIQRSRVYFSSPQAFNDPLDCAPVLAFAGDLKDPAFIAELAREEEQHFAKHRMSPAEIAEFRAQCGEEPNRAAQVAKGQIRAALRDETRIFCLSGRRDEPVMWSHYADHHRGVCLHFACPRKSVMGYARAVRYSEVREPILLPLDRQDSDAIMDRMVLQKAAAWKYEEEFRIIADTTGDWGGHLDGGHFCNFDPALLVGLTLGMKIGDAEKAELLELAGNHAPPLQVWQALEDEGAFKMRFERLA